MDRSTKRIQNDWTTNERFYHYISLTEHKVRLYLP